MNTEEFIPVKNSSNIAAVQFDEPANVLYVEFKGGSVYRYDKVAEQDGRIIVETAGMDKISTGQLINRFIKQPKLPYKKL